MTRHFGYELHSDLSEEFWRSGIWQNTPRSQKLAQFLESTLGEYLILYDQTITGISFDNMSIVMAKASTMGFRVINITVGGTPRNSLCMYALLEKAKWLIRLFDRESLLQTRDRILFFLNREFTRAWSSPRLRCPRRTFLDVPIRFSIWLIMDRVVSFSQ